MKPIKYVNPAVEYEIHTDAGIETFRTARAAKQCVRRLLAAGGKPDVYEFRSFNARRFLARKFR